MYQESFIRNNPAKFVGTAWVNVDDLKGFLSAREVRLNIYGAAFKCGHDFLMRVITDG